MPVLEKKSRGEGHHKHIKKEEEVEKAIKKETDKAVLVENDKKKDVWLPKSKIKIEEGKVTEIADWLKEKHDIS